MPEVVVTKEEIEVTPQMIEAGASVLIEQARFFDERSLASMVYTAMQEALNRTSYGCPSP